MLKISKELKIFLSVISSLLLSVGFDCLFGFTAGGEAGVLYVALLILFSFSCAALAVFIVNGRDYFKGSYRAALVWTAIGICAFTYFLYSPLNSLSKSQEYTQYSAEVVWISQYKGFLSEDITLRDGRGNEFSTQTLEAQISIYDDDFQEGSEVVVREYEGGFGFPVYELIKDENDGD